MHLSQVSPPEAFDFQAADKWDRWLRRFERYRLAAGLHSQPENIQVNSLLYSMGPEADDLLDSFHLPTGDLDRYDIVTRRFSDHFGKKRNYVYERARFHQRCQTPGESVDTFINDLFRLAERCNFQGLHDEMIRDRLIAGLSDAHLSERLQLDPDMTLEKALASARQRESVRAQQRVVRADHDSTSLHALMQQSQHHSSSSLRSGNARSGYSSSTPHSSRTPRSQSAGHSRDQVGVSSPTPPRQDSQPPARILSNSHSRSQQGSSRPPSNTGNSSAVAATGGQFAGRSSSECAWCGFETHRRDQCPARNQQCTYCGKQGHFQRVCRQLRRTARHDDSLVHTVATAQTSTHLPSAFLGSLSGGTGWSVSIVLNGTPLVMKVDTGADVTAISTAQYDSLQDAPVLTSSDRALRGPNGIGLQVLGKFAATIRQDTPDSPQSSSTDVYVVDDLNTALLGRPAIETLGILQPPANVLATSVQDIHDQFPTLFTGIGSFGTPHTIRLRDGAQPYSLSSARRIPIPLEPKVIEALQSLESSGVIRRVTEPTEWCAGLVVVQKRNGDVRLCGDFTRLNPAIRRERHIMPTTDRLLARIGDAKVFSKLDANSGFHQVPLTESSQLLTTFITPIGRFCYTRLPFGISSAPEYFQKQMSDLLSDLPGVLCMVDDILTFGATEEEEDRNLQSVLSRLAARGVTLNTDKCLFHQRRISFLGHLIDSDGIRPDPEKIRALQDLPVCKDVSAVRRLLGMATHLGKFIPDLSTITQPLRALLVKGTPWTWSESQQTAFDHLKRTLSAHPVLAPYSPDRESTVSADASSFGLGAVLLQTQADGSQRPVSYQSRSLTPAETRYSQIEKEALAVTWACDRFSELLIGTHFHIETDHKPLVSLLGSRPLDDLPPRVLRFRLRLLRFAYDITHIPGKSLVIADALSRAPVADSSSNPAAAEPTLSDEAELMVMQAVHNLPATPSRLEEILSWQESDPVCTLIVDALANGWPHQNQSSPDLRPYVEHRAHISLTADGLLLYNDRIVIPSDHQADILAHLHAGHQGIAKTRRLAQQSVWWPTINKDIEVFVKSCYQCLTTRSQHPEPLLPSPLPDLPWQRLAADFFQLGNRSHLLVVDYYSRFIEVVELSTTTAARTIAQFKSIFARHGIPAELVTDNGPQFSSAEFEEFAKSYCFRHTTSSPLFPQSNGLAERSVRTVKSLLSKADDPYLALLNYRSTPLESGYSPSQLLMSRRLRSTIPVHDRLLQPQLVDPTTLQSADDHQKQRQASNYDRRHRTSTLPPLHANQPVYISDRQESGTVLSQPAMRSYIIQTPSGQFRRNRRAIIAIPPTPPVSSIDPASSAPPTPCSSSQSPDVLPVPSSSPPSSPTQTSSTSPSGSTSTTTTTASATLPASTTRSGRPIRRKDCSTCAPLSSSPP